MNNDERMHSEHNVRTRRPALHGLSLIVLLQILLIFGCTEGDNPPSPDRVSGAPTKTSPLSTGNGTIVADPNPIEVCEFPEFGATTISWKAPYATSVAIHIDSPSGELFARRGPEGSATTGKWIQNGTIFYLQDISNNEPLTSDHTLATVEISVVGTQCP